MADFGMIKSFDIDNGELDGKTPQECFVLGYELARIDSLLKSDTGEWLKLVHADNKERIQKSCEESGRRYKFLWESDDVSEMWMTLVVAAF